MNRGLINKLIGYALPGAIVLIVESDELTPHARGIVYRTEDCDHCNLERY